MTGSVLTPFLLLQILSETTTPTTPDKCVTVRYQGTVYRAMSVSRSRMSGALTVTMPGDWEAIGTPPPTTPAHAQQLARQQIEFDACVQDRKTKHARADEAHQRWEQCRATYGFNCGTEPPRVNRFIDLIDYECERPAYPLAPQRRKSGRQVQLSGYEAITNDTDCHCPVFSRACVEK